MTRRVTIRDVAERAGVSPQTVSRAINDKSEISAETRERILVAVRELGYRPSHIAQGLKTNRTQTIGLVVPDIANPFFAELARGAAEIAHAEGYGVLLCNTDEQPEREWATLQMLETHRVDGLLLASSRLDDERLEEAASGRTPLLLVNRQLSLRPGTACILMDDETAAATATRHLLERGHRVIGFVGGLVESRSARARLAGYLRTLQWVGIPPEHSQWVPGAPTVQAGRTAALALLQACPQTTALLAYNDLVAVGTLQACASLGRRVPTDCAILGWDDIELAACVSPPLSTMRQPTRQLGERAMDTLLTLLRTPTAQPETAVLQAELVVRQST